MHVDVFGVVPAEIGGGWLVWQTVRNKKPWYYLVGGEQCLAEVL
jgi:drug/metabolite transporter superfamily protein YnfA